MSWYFTNKATKVEKVYLFSDKFEAKPIWLLKNNVVFILGIVSLPYKEEEKEIRFVSKGFWMILEDSYLADIVVLLSQITF